MPSPAQILETLASIASGRTAMAIAWHVVLAAVVAAVLAGWRPVRKPAGTAMAVPLLSVASLAWVYGNPFNAIVFLLFAVLLAALGSGLPAGRVTPAPAWARIVGASLVAFGWVYPHFLAGGPWWKYLYAAPTGLIPCPTLSALVGLTFLAGGFSSRAFPLTLGFLGLFYGAFGAFRLGVTIDIVLLTGSVVLMAFAQKPPRREVPSRRG
jgi:hypothetical protein